MTAAASVTIADLQAERERLRAANAKADYEAALAETVGGPELVAAGQAARAAVIAALDTLADRFVEALSGERDETRVHYLMSEAAHEWLTAIGERVAGEAAEVPDLGDRFRRGVKPRDLLTVSQWAERHRELRSGTNAPGPWNNALTPYLVEIMDCLSEHSPVRQVTFIKSSGVGGPLALDTPVPTPAGWTTMGEIREGDRVFDEAGRPCNVTYVSPVFDGRQCYEIEFSDGAVIVCDDEHRWTVDDRFPGHTGK